MIARFDLLTLLKVGALLQLPPNDFVADYASLTDECVTASEYCYYLATSLLNLCYI